MACSYLTSSSLSQAKVFHDLFAQWLRYLFGAMIGNHRSFPKVFHELVTASLPFEHYTLRFEPPNEFAVLHGLPAVSQSLGTTYTTQVFNATFVLYLKKTPGSLYPHQCEDWLPPLQAGGGTHHGKR